MSATPMQLPACDYISVTVMPPAAPSWVKVVLLPLRVPFMPPHGMLPLTSTLVRAPVAVLRLYVPYAGLVVDVAARQVMPKIVSCIWKPPPMTNVLRPVIFGSAPMNPSYVTCQGKVACRIVALPDAQPLLLTVALEMCPIRAWSTLVIVDECRLPSSVTGQTVVPKPPAKVILAQVALMFLLVVLILLADALPTSAPRMTVAPIRVISTLAYLDIRISFGFGWSSATLWTRCAVVLKPPLLAGTATGHVFGQPTNYVTWQPRT